MHQNRLCRPVNFAVLSLIDRTNSPLTVAMRKRDPLISNAKQQFHIPCKLQQARNMIMDKSQSRVTYNMESGKVLKTRPSPSSGKFPYEEGVGVG